MNDTKYLYDMNNKSDWLRVNMDMRDGKLNEELHIISYPEGVNQRFEVIDSIFYGQASYHEHAFGWETFFVLDGSIDFIVHGKICTVTGGDILHLQPYCSHQMIFKEKTHWRGTFHDINMCGIVNNWNRTLRYLEDQLKTPIFTASYLANRNNIIRESPVYTRVDKSELTEIRSAERWLNRFDLEGVCMKQITARWENNGVNEIWRFEMDDGFSVNFRPVIPVTDLFYVTDGEIDFKVGEQSFTAYPDCLVKIPPYVPRSFRSKGKSAIYDFGGTAHWLDMTEDYLSICQNKPEKLHDESYMNPVLDRHECYIQNFGIAR